MPPITHFSQLDPTQTYTYADYLTWQLDEWVEIIRGRMQQEEFLFYRADNGVWLTDEVPASYLRVLEDASKG